MTGKLKFHKSTTCILGPQKSSFKLPMVLKTDFKRGNNALSRGISLYTLGYVPVNDFSLSISSILRCKKSLKIM